MQCSLCRDFGSLAIWTAASSHFIKVCSFVWKFVRRFRWMSTVCRIHHKHCTYIYIYIITNLYTNQHFKLHNLSYIYPEAVKFTSLPRAHNNAADATKPQHIQMYLNKDVVQTAQNSHRLHPLTHKTNTHTHTNMQCTHVPLSWATEWNKNAIIRSLKLLV